MGIRLDIQDGMSKEEEVKVLNKLYETFSGTDTYLEQLFTGPFTVWASQKIRDDIFPEVMQYIHPERDDEELDRLRRRVGEEKARADANADLIHRLEKEKELNNRSKMIEIEEFRTELNQITKENYDLVGNIEDMLSTIGDLEMEVLKLKAELYDRMK